MATTGAINLTSEIVTPAVLQNEQILFSYFDYSVFGLSLVASAMIGIWFGYFRKKEDSTTEYLLGGRNMAVFPIAMSLISSDISGITVLGAPTDIYAYGSSYWTQCLGIVMFGWIGGFVYLPVFYKLQLNSSYEYLKLRFSNVVRLFASFMYVMGMITFIPIVIYVPALALSEVSGMSLNMVTPIVCATCIFYTTIGGLKAVVWTDTLQLFFMVGAMVTILILGIFAVGGISNVWDLSERGGRIDFFNMNPDPTIRNSFWSVTFAMPVGMMAYIAINQACVQRFLALPTIDKARKSMVIFIIGVILIKTISTLTGLMMFAKYADCDPYTAGIVNKYDQVMPHYVMDVSQKIFGLPGLFVAGVFSAALSTMSTGMNSMAGTIYEDFLSPLMPANTSEAQASKIMKIIVVITGILSTGLVFVVNRLEGILQVTLRFSGMTSGPKLGLFTLGMLCPFANTKGALTGGIGGLIFMTWMAAGAQYHAFVGNIKYPQLPYSVDGCDFPVNVSAFKPNITATLEENKVFFLYRISYYYYCILGTIVTLSIGILVSWFTGGKNEKVDPDLLSPVVHRFHKTELKYSPPPHYDTVELELLKKSENKEKELSI